MKRKKYVLCSLMVINAILLFSQNLKPGFNKEEYRELMLISARTATIDSNYVRKTADPQDFKMIYRSEPMGLDNQWDLWVDDAGKAAISIRGTTTNPESWLANFYASMVPAKGSIQIADNQFFNYSFSNHPEAAVHVGWLLCTAYLANDIIPKIIELYQQESYDFLIIGHSQGGAIAYLLTSHLANLQAEGVLPSNLNFKTYCSAAPKPGNLFYAYEFEALTQNGWAYNVVNAADWVPEVPISIQTLDDFNKVNPFTDATSNISTTKLSKKIALKHVYNQLDQPTKKALKNYQKYLGEMISKAVQDHIPGFNPPEYFDSNNYVRTGTSVVLMPDDEYYTLFPKETKDFFTHHSHHSYLYLLNKVEHKGCEKGL